MNNDIDWKAIFSEIVWPNISTFILYITMFMLLGITLSIVYIIFLWKKKVFVRKPKYYNWAVKLYIPFLFIVFIYFSFQVALLFSAKKIIHRETEKIVNELYESTVSQFFESPQERQLFIRSFQEFSKTLQNESDSIESKIEEWITGNYANTDIKEKSQNKLASYLVKRYKVKLYTLALYGLIQVSNNQTGIKEISYKDVEVFIEKVNTLDAEQIENSIKYKFTGFVSKTVDSQIHSLILGSLLIFILLIILPVFEWWIYRWWMTRKELKEVKVELKV